MLRIAGIQFGGHVDKEVNKVGVAVSVIPELRAMWGYYRDRRPDLYGPLTETPNVR